MSLALASQGWLVFILSEGWNKVFTALVSWRFLTIASFILELEHEPTQTPLKYRASLQLWTKEAAKNWAL